MPVACCPLSSPTTIVISDAGGIIKNKKKEEMETVVADPARKRVAVQDSTRSLGIPPEYLQNEALNKRIQTDLPPNYNFELPKCLWQIHKHQARRVALQFPEGLLLFSLQLASLIEEFGGNGVETVILSDVAYGACCVDDLQAERLGCDYMIHFGHSCLVPINVTRMRTLYVFVEIEIDAAPLVQVLKDNFPQDAGLAFVGTIQFNGAICKAKRELEGHFRKVLVPQARPLSAGEILGCTAPRLPEDVTAIVYVGDGRFHLEAMMMANPRIAAYKYDPYTKLCTREEYDHAAMKQDRLGSIARAQAATHWGVILGAIGRQGNPAIVSDIVRHLQSRSLPYTLVVMDEEIMESRLEKYGEVHAWVQVACPRLSIDWGYTFSKPLLTPFEFNVAMGLVQMPADYLPMDYYAREVQGPWGNYHPRTKDRRLSLNN